MKFRIRHILMLVVLFVVVKTTRSLLYPSQTIASTPLKLHISPNLSAQTKESISRFFDSLDSSNIAYCQQEVVDRFPMISHVDIRRQASSSIEVRCIADEPLVAVPLKGIITRGSRLVPFDCYDMSVCTCLPVCNIAQQEMQVDASCIKEFFARVSSELINNYAISWHSQHEMSLRSITHDEVSIIVAPDQLISVEQVRLAERLIKEYKEQKNTTNKGKQFIADLRFDHRIILHERAKGA